MATRAERAWAWAKTAGLVTVVAVLIWVWAEAESIESGVAVTRVVFSRSPDMVVRVEGQAADAAVPVQVRLEGSTVAIDEATAALRHDIELAPGVGVVPGPPGGTVNLLEAIRESREVRRTGATVVAADPAAVRIEVVKLTTREIPVQAELVGIEAEGDVIVGPQTVRVTMPENLAQRLPPAATAAAVVTPEDLASSTEDGAQTVPARLRLPTVLTEGPEAEFVSVPRDTFRVTLRVKRRVETMELPPVPVWITIPPTEGTGWDIEVAEPLLRGVTATGPADLVGRIRRRELVVIAFVVLSSDDLRAKVESKTAVFAPVPAALIGIKPAENGAGGPGRAGGAGNSGLAEAAMMEQVAPLKFSVGNRLVKLKIQPRAKPSGEEHAGAPAPD